MTSLGRWLPWAVLAAGSASPDAWQTVQQGPITIKDRDRPNTAVKEIWAEGDIDAPPAAVQQVLMTPGRFPTFMPYVSDARELGHPDADGGQVVYTKLDLPVVA